jgi:hypothetical protein
MHVQDVARTCLLMQIIDILSAQEQSFSEPLPELGHGEVRGIRFGRRGDTPAHGIKIPYQARVSLPSLRTGNLLEPVIAPKSSRIPESWDSAFGGDPRACENEHPIVSRALRHYSNSVAGTCAYVGWLFTYRQHWLCFRIDCGLRFVSIDHQLIADLSPAAEDRMRRQFDYAFCVSFGKNYPKRPYHLGNTYHSEVFVDHNHVEGKQHADRVDRICWDDPHSTIRLERSSTEQSDQAAHNRVGHGYPKGKKRSFRLVIDKDFARASKHTFLQGKGDLGSNEELFSSCDRPAAQGCKPPELLKSL